MYCKYSGCDLNLFKLHHNSECGRWIIVYYGWPMLFSKYDSHTYAPVLIVKRNECTYHFLSTPVHSYWGTSRSSRWASLPTSPRPPVGSRWWRHLSRKTARPRWSAGRRSGPWPAGSRSRCPPTCPGKHNHKETSVCVFAPTAASVYICANLSWAALSWQLTKLRYCGSSSLDERVFWVFKESKDLILRVDEGGTHTLSSGAAKKGTFVAR